MSRASSCCRGLPPPPPTCSLCVFPASVASRNTALDLASLQHLRRTRGSVPRGQGSGINTKMRCPCLERALPGPCPRAHVPKAYLNNVLVGSAHAPVAPQKRGCMHCGWTGVRKDEHKAAQQFILEIGGLITRCKVRRCKARQSKPWTVHEAGSQHCRLHRLMPHAAAQCLVYVGTSCRS